MDNNVKIDKSNEYFQLALKTNDIYEALKYAKKAIKLNPHNIQAKVFVVDSKNKSVSELLEKYEKILDEGEMHLKELQMHKKDNEYESATKSYMLVKLEYIKILLECKMIKKALEEAKELLAMNQEDPLNVKDILMHIYVYLENEKDALVISKKNLHPRYFLPLSVLYYKLCDFKKSKKYLKLLEKKDESIKEFFNSMISNKIDDFLLKISDKKDGIITKLIEQLLENEFLYKQVTEYYFWANEKLKLYKIKVK